PSAQEDTAQREDFERQVGGFGTVNFAKHGERVNANRVASRKRRLAYRSGRIARGDLPAKPRGLFGPALAPQETIDIPESRTRKDALAAGVAEFVRDEPEQLDLFGAVRREIAVPAFGCDRIVFVALPDQRRFAQSGARGKHRDVAVLGRIFRAMQN